MAAKKSKQEPAVHVVFDTNCLYTGRIDKLFSEESSAFIKQEIMTLDVDHFIYVPYVVRSERKRQMHAEAGKLYPSVNKLERLLGQTFVNDELISSRIEKVINTELEDHKVSVLHAEYTSVDWSKLVDAALFRHAPFDQTTSDKGFKDAVILETICQLHATLPHAAEKALLCIVCNDERLQEALQARLGGAADVQVCSGLGELTTALSAVRSAVSQEVADQYVTQAENLFSESPKSLRDSWGIRDTANKTASTSLAGYTVTIGSPRKSKTAFTKKNRTKIHFRTIVPFNITASHYVTEEIQTAVAPNKGLLSGGTWGQVNPRLMTGNVNDLESAWSSLGNFGNSDSNAAASSAATTPNLGLSAASYGIAPQNALATTQIITSIETFTGVWNVAVDWSATVNPSGELVDPLFEEATATKAEWLGSDRRQILV